MQELESLLANTQNFGELISTLGKYLIATTVTLALPLMIYSIYKIEKNRVQEENYYDDRNTEL